MDLFSITCTTCKTRLKVRDEGVIGNILGCPKCGGMVMVKPPEGWQKGAAPHPPQTEQSAGITTLVEVPRNDETLGEVSFDAVDDLLSDAPPKVKTPLPQVAENPPALARPRFVGGPPAGAAPASATADDAAREDAVPDAASGLPATETARKRPWPFWVPLAASIAAGIVLAVAVVAAAIKFGGTRQQEAITIVPTSNNSAEAAPIGPDEAPNPRDTVIAPSADAGPMESPVTDDVPARSDPAENTPPEAPVPADVDPLEPAKVPSPSPKAPENPLAAFDKILAGDATDPIAEAPMPQDAPPPPVEPDSEPGPPRPVLPRPAPREIDVAARLADPLPSIETSGTPLASLLQFFSDLSTIPITLHPDALPLIKLTPQTPLALKAANTTVGDALTAALKPVGLEYIVDGQHLVVRPAEPSPSPTLRYPVKDLTGGDAQRGGELAEMLKALIEPGEWEGEAGTILPSADFLTIRQRREIHAQLFFACEKLRTARKLPHASRYDPVLFKLDTRSQLAKTRLETPITLNFSQPTSLVRIVERLGAAGGVQILVDWRDIASAGWTPEAEATLTVEKQTLSAALTALAEPMDLAWRIVDGRTLQLVTPQRLAETTEIELYKVNDLLADDPTSESLLATIRETLGDAAFRENGGPGEVLFDGDGQCILAALPQPKQQQLEALLAKMQK